MKRTTDGTGLVINAAGNFPLQDSILEINRRFGFNISFEAAPVSNASDIVDADPAFHQLNPESRENYLVRARPFSLTVPVALGAKPLREPLLQRLVNSYNASASPGVYSVVGDEVMGYSIVGRTLDAAAGTTSMFALPLDCVISLQLQPMTLHEALGQVAAQIKQSCQMNINANMGDTYPGSVKDVQVSGTFQGLAAREVVKSLLAQERRKLFYFADFEPVLGRFSLAAMPCFRTTTNSNGERILVPEPKKQ